MVQNAGILPTLDLNVCGVREREIIKDLSQSWFITRLEYKDVGKDRFYSVFLKPSDEIYNKFHLFGDVLCVLHPHPILDGRVFDYIEKNLNSNQFRLDKLCVLLVSNASEVEEKTTRISSETEARIVVPFRYNEFKGGKAGNIELMLNKLTENLYTKNLFAISSALKTDRYFFGRKADIQRLIGKYNSGENGSIFGLRRIGKTSVLWAVVRELGNNGSPVILIDCSDTRYHGSSWNQTLFNIKSNMFNANQMKGQGNKSSEYSTNNASIAFQQDLELIRNKYKKPILIIFDEIENLTFDLSPSPSWASGNDYLFFWQTIRSIFQQNTNLFSFLICGVNPFVLEKPFLPDGKDNPLYRYIEPNYLGFFDLNDVDSMISMIGGYMGIEFDKEIYTYLTDDYGGHPFLIRQVCGKIYEIQSSTGIPRKIKISKEYYKTNKVVLASYLSDYIDLILKILVDRYPNEFKLLQYLSVGEHENFISYAEDPNLISHLTGYGLISKSFDKYHFQIQLVEDSVKRQSMHLRTPSSPEEMWSLMSQERNKLETRLRETVRSTLKISFGSIDAKDKIIKAMNKSSQITKAQQLSYDEIFKGELYFNDLKNVINNCWTQFGRIFENDMTKFSKSMTTANKYRIDAHAKTIVQSQFKEAISSLYWLTECIDVNT